MSGLSQAACLQIQCAVCSADIAALGVAARNAHVEACLDSGTAATPPPARQVASGEVARLAATLERVDSCPVCGAVWTVCESSRVAHAKACAARHGLAAKDLGKLVDMFRESLDSSCATVPVLSDPQPKRAGDQKGASTAKARSAAARKAPSPGSPGTIDGWLGRRASEERMCSQSDCKSRPSTTRETTGSSGSIFFEVAADEDFQSTIVRLPLRQATISLRRISKKRQELLDELDDELSEAKALSLSLTRVPYPKRNRLSSRSCKERPAAAGALERSDILACAEAQCYLRQRSVALEHMDEEGAASAHGSHGDGGGAGARGQTALHPGASSRLWIMSSQAGMLPDMYCPMFVKYRAGGS